MDTTETRSEMSGVVEIVKGDISTIRTGRATPNLVEDIIVSVYGGTQKFRLLELASITAPDSQTLVIDPWDKSIAGEIRKGIQAANIGLTPSLDGEIIRISLPPLTTEDRQKYVKLLSSKLEQGKVMIRRVRGDIMHAIKTKFENKEITEDEKFKHEKDLQGLTDEFIAQIDSIGEIKRKELLTN
ncbi:ribosome recycling factor [Candidatus Woesebacteria bacterium RIFOXYB1_FULL_38_16]|uniref:Ribosome recycling factor n=1 Tax=Candidatus Woesebacteria bacterium RIFOXYB1_FULL_38_16 TaxID=1802538 RepID=A0A1F8CUR0_9BACT|nr:MAG: ribosome recycling factor [Candidatus Woesebacteria bacterium RIFOXYB1_FULL_38_16]